MLSAVHKKRNVLMLGLFAVVGFNISLNPESIEVRRTIASQSKSDGSVDLASAENQMPILSVQLGEIFKAYKGQDVSFSRKVTVIRDNDKVKHIEVKFRLDAADTEGTVPDSFVCKECLKWQTVKLDANLFDKDDAKFKANIDSEIAIQLEAMRDKERASGDVKIKGRPDDKGVVESPLERDDCDQQDPGMLLSCKSRKIDSIARKCEITEFSTEERKKNCLNQLTVFYRENLVESLKQGLQSESAETRGAATSLRNKLFSLLPRTAELGNKIRMELVEQTKAGLQQLAKSTYEKALAEGKRRNYSPQDQARFAQDELKRFLSGEKTGFGDVSKAGGEIAAKFNNDMNEFERRLTMNPQSQLSNVAGYQQRLRNRVGVCQGAACPPAGNTAFFGSPNPTIPGSLQPKVYVPYNGNMPHYTGPAGAAYSPGSTFVRPF